MSTIYKGVRSTSVCFLGNKPNISIIAETEVNKVLCKDGRAYAIECIDNTGKALNISAKKEIILSAGVFHSPKVLMLSGIGPKDHLESFGIDCVVNSQHVGQNLLDHPIFPHVFKLKQGCGLDGHLLRAGPMKTAAVKAYTRNHTGPLHSGLLELVGFTRVDRRLEKIPAYTAAKKANDGLDPFGPDGQPHFENDFVPCFADAFQWHIPAPSDNSDHLTVLVDLLRPVSKPGDVKLLSADYKVQPYINLNFMENDLDIIALREGVRFVDDILMTGDGMKDIIGADYPRPMPRASDEAMNQTILERLQTGFHPCGTCRLSHNIGQGVVDPQLKVHRVDGLRVIDASCFPVIPDCRIQNVVYMVAEKGADMIKADHSDLYGRDV